MSPDTTITMDGALLQHGHASDRVYLMKMTGNNASRIIRFMDQLAEHHGYSKLFAKIPGHLEGWFQGSGYTLEARVPGMYNGLQDGCFMARYPRAERAAPAQPERVAEVLATARRHAPALPRALPAGWTIREMTEKETPGMAGLYADIFETYPFPIHDPAYLASTMKDHIRYFGVVDGTDTLQALASAEMDRAGGNAEMTDFATRPEARGRGLAGNLLFRMENAMRDSGMTTVYTIARAHAAGMNIVFVRGGYKYAGTLPNNTQIKGDLETMHVWYKPLDHERTEKTR